MLAEAAILAALDSSYQQRKTDQVARPGPGQRYFVEAANYLPLFAF